MAVILMIISDICRILTTPPPDTFSDLAGGCLYCVERRGQRTFITSKALSTMGLVSFITL